ncbi:MAG: hypothetical protein V8T12_05335 [Parabacteroides johnsonii]
MVNQFAIPASRNAPGGVTEQFEHCWEPVPHSYLTAIGDSRETSFPDLTDQEPKQKCGFAPFTGSFL